MKAINARIHRKRLNILMGQAGIVPEDLRLSPHETAGR